MGATHLRPAADKLHAAGREPAWRGPGFIPDGQPDADVHVQRPLGRVLRPGSRACRRGMELASNEIRIFVAVPRPPSAPAQLLAAVNGAEVALSWKNTFEGGPPVGLLLSGSTVASLPLGEWSVLRKCHPAHTTSR